jgi:hypothetical protein
MDAYGLRLTACGMRCKAGTKKVVSKVFFQAMAKNKGAKDKCLLCRSGSQLL